MSRAARVVLAALSLGAFARPALAQRVALEGLLAGEAWQTDAGSRLLARNGGELAGQWRVFGWASVRPARRVELLGVVYIEGGRVDGDPFEAKMDVAEARVTVSPKLVVEGGRLLMPIGTFGVRRFPNTNPVIGTPDLYPPIYPWGGEVSGTTGRFDYRAALVSRPSVNPAYVIHNSATIEPGGRLRPVIGAGVTLGPALHFGIAWTHGPYLGPSVDALMPAGTTWRDYAQSLLSADAHFSAGYLDVRGEAAWSSYEVPTKPAADGFGFYVEPRLTLAPRWFAAARLEYYRYAFVGVFKFGPGPANWTGNAVTEQNGELGVGYRWSAEGLVKVSARRDNWPGPDPSPNFHAPNGYAVAAQVAYHFSLASLLARTY